MMTSPTPMIPAQVQNTALMPAVSRVRSVTSASSVVRLDSTIAAPVGQGQGLDSRGFVNPLRGDRRVLVASLQVRTADACAHQERTAPMATTRESIAR